MLKWIVLFFGILLFLAGLGGIVWWLLITAKANSNAKFDDEDE